jgi:hypothetical protein
MKNNLSLVLVAVFLCCFMSGNTVGQSLLNNIRIDQCNPYDPKDGNGFDFDSLTRLIEEERRLGLVLDARPFAINQSTGKLNFNGKTGRVSVVHLNPFLYKYTISVAQEELVSSAVSDFIDILLPPALRSIGRLKSAEARLATTAPGNLTAIGDRLKFVCPNAADADCEALDTMKREYMKIEGKIANDFSEITGPLPTEILTLSDSITNLRDEQADAYKTCVRAHNVNIAVASYVPSQHVSDLQKTQTSLEEVTSLANDLGNLADQFIEDGVLKESKVRCGGFSCARQFKAYADAVLNLITNEYTSTLENRLDTWRQFQALLDLTNKMKGKEGLFARTFDVIKKFELSAATVSITRTKIGPKDTDTTASAQSESRRRSDQPPSTPPGNPFDNPNAGNGNHNEEAANEDKQAKDDDKPGSPKPVKADINESIQIGRPRFLVSGGLVYSPLPRQTFVSTTGFSRDAQGNPVGDSNKTIVGFDENSPRRLMPMVLLNSRLASFKPASIYFTLGVTAKHDKNIDVEYLIGPSVSMLNERAMFTFGAYAGKTSALVPDVKVGDEIPESAGNASLFTKKYTWKPGFSFSYVFSNLSKRSQDGGSTGSASTSASAADEFKDEIRIGDIPFNLAMGLAYTSLEDRVFDEVLGFARDREGNLTNGQTLTRIVGLATTSNYRLVPLAMLHSRLLNFGSHSFYFTSGVSGKKDDDNIQLEYLLGGSVNVYRRKLFFTFGAFAGKQQLLGGDLFPGAKLDPTQTVNVQSRYVWKPGFAFSYDISKIMPKGTKR